MCLSQDHKGVSGECLKSSLNRMPSTWKEPTHRKARAPGESGRRVVVKAMSVYSGLDTIHDALVECAAKLSSQCGMDVKVELVAYCEQDPIALEVLARPLRGIACLQTPLLRVLR